MQPQITPAVPAPERGPAPRLAPPPARPKRSRGAWWLAGLLLIAAIVAAIWYWQHRLGAAARSSAATASIRTARVGAGVLQRTIRLTGVTGAQNYVSLVAPSLRGSRGGRGRNSTGSNSATQSTQVASLAGGNSSSSGSSSSSSSQLGASAGGGGQNNMSSALRAATSRFGGSRSTSGARSSSSGSSSGSRSGSSGTTGGSTSAAMGSTGLGSTASSLFNVSGGGGGGDFNLVLETLVKPGARVKKGEPVATFDRQNMLLRLDDYKSSVLQHEASLRKLKADLEVQKANHDLDISKAKADLDKARLDMKTLPVLSEMDAERAKLALEEAEVRYKALVDEAKLVEESIRAQIRNEELDLDQSKIELARAQANADRMIIKAPINGLAVIQQIPRGGELQQVQAGDELRPGLRFLSIVDTTSMVVNATVNQVDVESLRLGAKARVRFDAYPDLILPARVYSIGALANSGGMRTTFVKEIPVGLKLEGDDPRVIPDLSVSADVIIESEPAESVIAPLAAVFRDSAAGAPYVFVHSGSGWTRREVELGLANNIAVSVRSGLRAREVVALERPPEAARSRK
jgi:HlyD family secretion protein